MSELKNCPFCGSEDTARLLYNDRADVERCRNCNLSIVVPFGFTMWNNRPIEDALQERNAELESERDEARAMVEKFIGLGSTLIDATSVAVHPKECEEWFDATDEWYGAQQ